MCVLQSCKQQKLQNYWNCEFDGAIAVQFTPHVTLHTSHLTPHTSHLTPHTSHLTRHSGYRCDIVFCCSSFCARWSEVSLRYLIARQVGGDDGDEDDDGGGCGVGDDDDDDYADCGGVEGCHTLV